MQPETKYYTTKGGAILRSSFLPGWGSKKLTQGLGSELLQGFGFISSFLLVTSNTTGNDREEFYIAHGALVLIDYIVILSTENKVKQKLYSSTPLINPGIKIQPNPVTGKNNLMFSLTINLD